MYEGRLNTWNEHKRFFVARFARIYPVYLLGLLLMYLASYAHHPDRFSWSKGIQVLFLVQAWHPFNHKIAGYWNGVAWTLSVEVFFYICFPAFLILFQRRGNKLLAMLFSAALFVAVLCKSPEMQLYGLQQSGNIANSLPFAILRLPEFVAGMLLGLLYHRRDPHHPNRWPLTSAGFFCAIFLLIMPYNSWNSLIVLPASALIYGLATQPTPLSYMLSTSAMQRLGQASYAIYLLQMGTYFLIDYAIRRFLPGLDANVSRIVIVSLILFSLLVFRYWEEPLRHQIRIRLGGSPTRP